MNMEKYANMTVQEKQSKATGLHSGTKFWEDSDNGIKEEYHEHPETKELVILHTWSVPNGEDDVDFEFEVVGVYPPVACELARMNKEHELEAKRLANERF